MTPRKPSPADAAVAAVKALVAAWFIATLILMGVGGVIAMLTPSTGG